jgi:hypothetical protein
VRDEVQTTQPPMMLVEEDSLDLEVDLPLKIVSTLLLWDMENMYGALKGPCKYSRTIGTIELHDFIRKFNT